MKYRFYVAFCLLWAAVTPALAAAGLVEVAVDGGRETVTINTPDITPHKVFLLPNPNRLVVDVPSIGGKPSVALPPSYKGTLLKNVRLGQFDPKTSRLVFDLAQPASAHETEKNGQLLVELSAAGSAPREEAAQPPRPSKIKTMPVKKNQKPIIVIDAGHGGVDPGTAGPSGTQEKDVVLDYARALKARLMKNGQYQVVLTRDDDTFIMLRKRVDIARKAGANLFISLHADSAPDLDARGLSIYTVSEKSSDQEAEALAARENKSDVLYGMDLSEEREDVAGILISLAERETKNRSAALADELVTTLDDKVPLLPNSHRFAGFAVLKAPDIPSVLIEIGFLSHPSEEKLLKSKAYREKVVGGIAAGVDAYFQLEKKLGQP
jgi:N-acetylmuramoyl-L-alanine amidase